MVFWCNRCGSKYFITINSFNPQQTYGVWLSHSFCRWGTRDTERLNNCAWRHSQELVEMWFEPPVLLPDTLGCHSPLATAMSPIPSSHASLLPYSLAQIYHSFSMQPLPSLIPSSPARSLRTVGPCSPWVPWSNKHRLAQVVTTYLLILALHHLLKYLCHIIPKLCLVIWELPLSKLALE